MFLAHLRRNRLLESLLDNLPYVVTHEGATVPLQYGEKKSFNKCDMFMEGC